jgi:hypothetical protein
MGVGIAGLRKLSDYCGQGMELLECVKMSKQIGEEVGNRKLTDRYNFILTS